MVSAPPSVVPPPPWPTAPPTGPAATPLQWAAEKTALIELAYALVASGAVLAPPGGKTATLGAIAAALGVPDLGPNPYNALGKIKTRKREGSTILDRLRKALEDYTGEQFWKNLRVLPRQYPVPGRAGHSLCISQPAHTPGALYSMQAVIPVGVPYDQLLNDLADVLSRRGLPAAPAGAPLAAPDEKLTIRQAAKRLDVCGQTIHDWKRKGLLPFQKLGGRVYILASDLNAAGEKQHRTAKPAANAKSR